MDKPINIVFCYHPESPEKTFLFQVPDDVMLELNTPVYVDTMYGERKAITRTESFWVSNRQLANIVAGCGAYYPIKFVTGLRKKVEEEKKIAFSIPAKEEVPF